jgi:type II secretory pathway component PulC
MKDNISPEEKLLRLIKGQKKQPKEPLAATTSSNVEAKPLNLPVSTFFRKFFFYLSAQKVISFFFAAAFLYLIASFIYPLWEKKKIELELKTPPVYKPGKETFRQPREQAKPFDFYLAGIKKRAIFNSLSSSESAGVASKVADADLIKDINLIGIISGETPQVIIEDKKAQKTYYLNKGQFIGNLQVDEIQEGKIILNYNGQKYELHL